MTPQIRVCAGVITYNPDIDSLLELLRVLENESDMTDVTDNDSSNKQDLEARMADPATYKQSGLIKELKQQHAEVEQSLEKNYADWETAQEELEKLIIRASSIHQESVNVQK